MTELVFRNDAYATSCESIVVQVDERGIQLDRTVFYPTGGGQPGDIGTVQSAAGDIAIAGTIMGSAEGDAPDTVIHVPAPGARTGRWARPSSEAITRSADACIPTTPEAPPSKHLFRCLLKGQTGERPLMVKQ